jgi:tetratricopeptide (TPR) repeat protein
MYMGMAYHCLGDAEKAKTYYEQAIATAPENWQTYRRLGVLHKQYGRPDEAMQTWKRGRCPELGRHRSGHLQWTGLQADRGQENPALLFAAGISRADEDIVKVGRGLVA